MFFSIRAFRNRAINHSSVTPAVVCSALIYILLWPVLFHLIVRGAAIGRWVLAFVDSALITCRALLRCVMVPFVACCCWKYPHPALACSVPSYREGCCDRPMGSGF